MSNRLAVALRRWVDSSAEGDQSRGDRRSFSIAAIFSDTSMEMVPTSTGRPALRRFSISSITAEYFSRLVLYTRSWWSFLMAGTLVGTVTTSSL